MLVTKTAKTVTNISKLSSTHFVSNIRHQYRCSRCYLFSLKPCLEQSLVSFLRAFFVFFRVLFDGRLHQYSHLELKAVLCLHFFFWKIAWNNIKVFSLDRTKIPNSDWLDKNGIQFRILTGSWLNFKAKAGLISFSASLSAREYYFSAYKIKWARFKFRGTYLRIFIIWI